MILKMNRIIEYFERTLIIYLSIGLITLLVVLLDPTIKFTILQSTLLFCVSSLLGNFIYDEIIKLIKGE